MTPLSRVITSFHPIERHSIHPLSADTNSARQAGQRMRQDGGGVKKEEWTVWRQGNKEKRREGGGRGGRGEGVDNSVAHHSQVCVQTLVRFWKKKRVALQRPSPPASHQPPPPPPAPHKYASVPGPPMGWRSGQWGHRNRLHINILPYSIAKQTVCDGSEGDFSSFFFFFF